MARYFLEIAYKGTAYHGWQIQPNAPSIQQLLNEKLSLKLGEEIYCIGCGRTDTGVHARRFFLHFDSTKKLKNNFIHKLNTFLPADVAVKALYEAPDEAHARFDAIERSYEYIIRLEKDPFSLEYAAFVWHELDVELMNQAAALLLQYEDFTALSKYSKEYKHYLCKITYARWERNGQKLVFKITANRFLRGMVRLIVGSLLQVGKGKMSVAQFADLIESKDRKKAGGAAPAEGLYLSEVMYPEGLLKQL